MAELNEREWEEFCRETHFLSDMLKDQHCGLMTWREAFTRRMERVHNLIGLWLADSRGDE